MNGLPKLTTEIKAQILAASQAGLDLESVADYAGIPQAWMNAWKDHYIQLSQEVTNTGELPEGLEDRELYETFRAAAQARANLEAGAMGVLMESAQKGDSSSAKWILERRFPEKYGKTENVTRVEFNEGAGGKRTDNASRFDELASVIERNAEEQDKRKQNAIEVASDDE